MLAKIPLVKSSNDSERGQVLVIILLVMVVGLTSGLFLLGRTTTDVTTSSNIVESTRAFNAAEAGIEEAIRSSTITGSPVPLSSGLTYQVAVQDLGNGSAIYPATKNLVKVGDVFTVWLVPHDESTNTLIEDKAQAYNANSINICFSDEVSGDPISAVSIMLYYKNGLNYETSFIGYDSDAARRSNENHFLATSGLGNCGIYGYTNRATVRLGNNSDFGVNLSSASVIPLALRIQSHYDNAFIAANPVGAVRLPKQGNQIASTGTSGVTSRKIQVSESFKQPAPFLDTTVYSFGANSLTK